MVAEWRRKEWCPPVLLLLCLHYYRHALLYIITDIMSPVVIFVCGCCVYYLDCFLWFLLMLLQILVLVADNHNIDNQSAALAVLIHQSVSTGQLLSVE